MRQDEVFDDAAVDAVVALLSACARGARPFDSNTGNFAVLIIEAQRERSDRLQQAINAIETLYATRGWSDGFRERLRQILDDVKASDGSQK